MSYRRRGYYRYQHWNRSYSKYDRLKGLFGEAVDDIRTAFLRLDESASDDLLADYGGVHGDAAERYARATLPSWRRGATTLSGQTLERLVELVPPYLSAEQRFSLLQKVLQKHKRSPPSHVIRINVKDPQSGFSELDRALASMRHDDVLANLPASVMKAATWLYDDDITAARAMLASAERRENDDVRASATREIALLKRTIASGQVQTASYKVTMPAGTMSVHAYIPSKCFVATVCFSVDAWQTQVLQKWRDQCLMERWWGRAFVIWYYHNGGRIAEFVDDTPLLKPLARGAISAFALLVLRLSRIGEKNG